MINQSRYKWNAEFCFQRQLRLQTSWQNDFKYAISFCYGMDFAYVLSYVLAPKIMMENVRHNKQTPWEIEGQGTARAGDWCNFLLAHSNCQEAAWHQKWSQKKLICHSGLHFIIHPHRIYKHQVISGQILLSKKLRTGWRDHHAGTLSW